MERGEEMFRTPRPPCVPAPPRPKDQRHPTAYRRDRPGDLPERGACPYWPSPVVRMRKRADSKHLSSGGMDGKGAVSSPSGRLLGFLEAVVGPVPKP